MTTKKKVKECKMQCYMLSGRCCSHNALSSQALAKTKPGSCSLAKDKELFSLLTIVLSLIKREFL
jgi:hypothetical protein